MKDFTTIQRIIIGGISSFRFVEADGISVFPLAKDLEIIESDIILKPGYEWQTGFADYNTLEYTEEVASSGKGVRINQKLTGALPDDLLANLSNLQKSYNKKYVVIFKTHQSTSRVVGSPADPCRFLFSFTTGKLNTRKGVSFEFTKQCKSLALYLKDTSIYFYINNLGQLIQEGTNDETFTLNSDGKFVVAGPDESDYTINSSGKLEKA